MTHIDELEDRIDSLEEDRVGCGTNLMLVISFLAGIAAMHAIFAPNGLYDRIAAVEARLGIVQPKESK